MNLISNNKELKMLIDATRDAEPEDILFVIETVKKY